MYKILAPLTFYLPQLGLGYECFGACDWSPGSTDANQRLILFLCSLSLAPTLNCASILHDRFHRFVCLLQVFVDAMEKQGGDCHLINTASGAGLYSQHRSTMGPYVASKHCAVVLTQVSYHDQGQAENASWFDLVFMPPRSDHQFAAWAGY